MQKIVDPKFLPFLIFTICYTGFIVLFLREKVLRKVLELRIPMWVGKVVTFVSIALLILSLIDEIGLFLNEWYFYPKVFSMIRSIMGIPGVSYLVYFANFALLIPFFYQIIETNRQKSNNAEYDTLQKLASIHFSVDLLTVSFQLTSAQLCLTYANIQQLQWVLLPAILIFCMVLSSALTRRIEKQIAKNSIHDQDRRGIIRVMLLYGMVLLQTMITKAGLLLAAFYWVINIFRKLGKKIMHSKEHPFQAQVFLESLATHLNPKDWKDMMPMIILFSSIFSATIFWQVNQSPFPPSGGYFPKDTTINLLYTVDIFLFLVAIIASSAEWLLTSIATIFLLFTRYATIILFPKWYVSGPSTLHNLNTVEGFAITFGHNIVSAVLIGFSFHLITAIFFSIAAANNKYYNDAILEKNANYIKPYFISIIAVDWAIVLLGVFLQILAFLVYLNSQLSAKDTLIIVLIGYLIFFTLFSLMIHTEWMGVSSRPKLFFANIRRVYKNRFLGTLNKTIPLTRHYSQEKIKGIMKFSDIPIYLFGFTTMVFLLIITFRFFMG